MHNIFNITIYFRFLSLYVVIYISVIKSRERLVAVIAVWVKFTTLFKFAKILNSKATIGIDLRTCLTYLANTASNFNC